MLPSGRERHVVRTRDPSGQPRHDAVALSEGRVRCAVVEEPDHEEPRRGRVPRDHDPAVVRDLDIVRRPPG